MKARQRKRMRLALRLAAAVALIVFFLFPLYWLFVTSFKDTNSVGRGPFYFPFIDFQPTFDAWHDVLVDQGSETFRPYINTVVIGLTSATVAVLPSRSTMVMSGARVARKARTDSRLILSALQIRDDTN